LLEEIKKDSFNNEVPDNITLNADDVKGKSVCFTGEMQCKICGERASRSFAEKKAHEKGMILKKGVSKKLDMLVTADPESMSGKAKKARQLGVRVIAEPVFWRMIGMEIE